ncbi:MAG: hypothetical protein ACJAVK_003684, partial [Akkermansiaceae bacterium]
MSDYENEPNPSTGNTDKSEGKLQGARVNLPEGFAPLVPNPVRPPIPPRPGSVSLTEVKEGVVEEDVILDEPSTEEGTERMTPEPKPLLVSYPVKRPEVGVVKLDP